MANLPENVPGAPAAPELEDAIARLKSAIENLEAEARAPAPSQDSGSTAPRAPPQAAALMDWLRADLSGRYFGVEPVRQIEIVPLGYPQPEVPLAIPEPGTGHLAPAPEPATLPILESKDSYALGELLAFHDEAFVRNAYRALMRREADPHGFE